MCTYSEWKEGKGINERDEIFFGYDRITEMYELELIEDMNDARAEALNY